MSVGPISSGTAPPPDGDLATEGDGPPPELLAAMRRAAGLPEEEPASPARPAAGTARPAPEPTPYDAGWFTDADELKAPDIAPPVPDPDRGAPTRDSVGPGRAPSAHGAALSAPERRRLEQDSRQALVADPASRKAFDRHPAMTNPAVRPCASAAATSPTATLLLLALALALLLTAGLAGAPALQIAAADGDAGNPERLKEEQRATKGVEQLLKKLLTWRTKVACSACKEQGGAVCTRCGGKGQYHVSSGHFTGWRTCEQCAGLGKILCKRCGGQARDLAVLGELTYDRLHRPHRGGRTKAEFLKALMRGRVADTTREDEKALAAHFAWAFEPIARWKDVHVELAPDLAAAKARYTVEGRGKSASETLDVIQVDGEWYVAPPPNWEHAGKLAPPPGPDAPPAPPEEPAGPDEPPTPDEPPAPGGDGG